jgi:hypothetical protein
MPRFARALAGPALLLVGVASFALGCESRVSLGGRCTRREECAALLTCVGGLCREECTGPSECPSGQRCIAGPSGVRACTRPVEETCDATDPCDPSVFAECRDGRCVTGCTDGSTCVSGTCDTSAAVGVCVEPISTGGADAGPLDAAAPVDAAEPIDAPSTCLPAPAVSPATLSEAVLGAMSVTRNETSLWVEMLGAPALDLAASNVTFGLGVRAGGTDAPRLLTAVNLGPHDAGEVEVSIHRSTPFAMPAVIEPSTELASGIGFGAIAARSGPDETSVALLRPSPAAGEDTDDFVWIVREAGGLVNLETGAMPSRFPGGFAFFDGPDVEFARELLALDELRADGTHQIGFVGAPFGEGNATQYMLLPEWGEAPYALASAMGAVLLHEPTSGRSLLARCTGAASARPLITAASLDLAPTDSAPALLATSDPMQLRAVRHVSACGELPIDTITCTGSSCTTRAATTALDTTDVLQLETTAWGSASVVMTRSASGASIAVLDADGLTVTETLSLAATETHELEAVTLREAHLAASVSGTTAVLALGGLYVDAAGGGRLFVRLVRLER